MENSNWNSKESTNTVDNATEMDAGINDDSEIYSNNRMNVDTTEAPRKMAKTTRGTNDRRSGVQTSCNTNNGDADYMDSKNTGMEKKNKTISAPDVNTFGTKQFVGNNNCATNSRTTNPFVVDGNHHLRCHFRRAVFLCYSKCLQESTGGDWFSICREYKNIGKLVDKTFDYLTENNAQNDDFDRAEKFIKQCLWWRTTYETYPKTTIVSSKTSSELEQSIHKKNILKRNVEFQVCSFSEELQKSLRLIANHHGNGFSVNSAGLAAAMSKSREVVIDIKWMTYNIFKRFWKIEDYFLLLQLKKFIWTTCNFDLVERMVAEVLLANSDSNPQDGGSWSKSFSSAINSCMTQYASTLKPADFGLPLAIQWTGFLFHILARDRLDRGMPILSGIYPPPTHPNSRQSVINEENFTAKILYSYVQLGVNEESGCYFTKEEQNY